jgi:hypothetical protein
MNFLKGKKKAEPQPRTLPEIQQEYQQTAAAAGQAQYQVFVFSKEVEQLNAKLLTLNREAVERQQLDAKQAPIAAPAPKAEK